MSRADHFLDVAQRLREHNAPTEAVWLLLGKARHAFARREIALEELRAIEVALDVAGRADLEEIGDMASGVFADTED